MAILIVFVYALAKSVYLLLPIRLYAVEVGKIMQRYDEEPLSYVMFKVISTWEDTIKKSIAKISTIGSNLGEIVKLIIIGLGLLVVSFLLLGVEFYLMESSADPSALVISLKL